MRHAEAEPRFIGAREAERILGVSRAALHRLAKEGTLPGRLIDRPGAGRKWRFKRADVLKVQRTQRVLRRKPGLRRIRVAWSRAFGPIQSGFTVIALDGDSSNTELHNLALVALRSTLKGALSRGGRRRRATPIEWTRAQIEKLRREFPTRCTSDIARELGASLQAVRCKARRMKLRKSRDYIVSRAREARSYPVGTEKIDRTSDNVIVKVSCEGSQREQWRPKHHVIWEHANEKSVPEGMRVIFKDGNKRNFDPSNLELATREEISARAFAQYLACPEPVRVAIRLTRKLQRQARQMQRQERNSEASKPKEHAKPSHKQRWSPEMDQILMRDYPSRPLSELMQTLRVSLSSIRQRARRLGIRRSPETVIAEATAAAAIQKAQALSQSR